jgi:predicted AAA+ superfamily ATPase
MSNFTLHIEYGMDIGVSSLDMPTYRRPALDRLIQRLAEPRQFLQVLAGARQVGKTTLARQIMAAFGENSTYATADGAPSEDGIWIEQQWEAARFRCVQAGSWLLVLDEVQKITNWSETVKRLWDRDTAESLDLRVILLGSSQLLMQQGLSESLAGRFEVLRIGHWSFPEMRDAFGLNVDQYLYFGGYPGAASLIGDEERWRRYLLDSLIEMTISRDILMMNRVDKPALLAQLFRLGCAYSSQILSYQKMLGQLQDAGNTTTLAHYLDLLAGAGMLCGLPKFSGEVVRQRGSSPKFQVLNNALMTAQSAISFTEARRDPERWGRIAESAIGAHLANGAQMGEYELFYWREVSKEVDFVLRRGDKVLALEVKSGNRRTSLPGMTAFDKAFGPAKKLLVGTGGIPIEEFLQISPRALLG